MNRRVSFAAVFLALTWFGYRTAAQKDPKVTEEALHRPTPTPDRIILTWSADPATTQAVTWRTDTSVGAGIAEIAEAEDGPLFLKKARKVNAAKELFESDINKSHYHSAVFEGLKPATLYTYRVGDGFNWSEWNQFRTASKDPAPLTFLYVGDAQTDIYSMWSRLIRMGYSDAPKTQFIVHAGDLINNADKDYQWGEWHRAAGWINHNVVSFPSPGNHEYGGKRLNRNWKPQFTLPGNGVPGLEETNYYLDIQGVRMVSLNSNEKRAEQAEWLDKLLADNPNQWTILTFHHPIFSTAKGRDNKDLRELWQPIFDKHAVDLVLTGHDHTYGRSNLTTGVSGKAGATVYVVSVSGPKQYNLDREAWMQRAAEDTQLFQIIRVDGNKLSYEARTARGALYDAFELQKQKGKPNKLTNRVPSTPENRRTGAAASSGL